MKKIIVTDEAGFDAARHTNPMTSEVSTIDIPANRTTILLFRFPKGADETNVARSCESIVKQINRVSPEGAKTVLLALPRGVTLEEIPPELLHRAGWTRAPEPPPCDKKMWLVWSDNGERAVAPRSEAFVREYIELCKKHGLEYYSGAMGDEQVIVPLSTVPLIEDGSCSLQVSRAIE